MKKILFLAVSLRMIMSSCAAPVEVPIPTTEVISIPTETPIPTVTPIPSATAYIPKGRPLVTLDMVKNINASAKISVGEDGEIYGLPDSTDSAKKELVKMQYRAIEKMYTVCDVYYSEDAVSGNFVLTVVMGGTLFHRLVINDDGQKKLYDFPTTFEAVEDGFELLGVYSSVTLPGSATFGVLWQDGVPQLLSNQVVLPEGDSYFTHYLIYDQPYSYTADLWEKVSGISEILAEIPSLEYDLNPKYVHSISYEYMGVKINADLVTDSSILPSSINRVKISDAVFAEYVARTLFHVWWRKGNERHLEIPTQNDFEGFMGMWALAQETGLVEDWSKVQINDLWINDLSDGSGYIQDSYSVWMMYDGDAPATGVIGINRFSVSLVCSDRDGFITKLHYGTWRAGYGLNLDKSNLSVYFYYDYYVSESAAAMVMSEYLSVTKSFMIINRGGEVDSLGSLDKHLVSILRSGLSFE